MINKQKELGIKKNKLCSGKVEKRQSDPFWRRLGQWGKACSSREPKEEIIYCTTEMEGRQTTRGFESSGNFEKERVKGVLYVRQERPTAAASC